MTHSPSPSRTPPAKHVAGGKRNWPLLKGCRGDAHFCGDREEFRPILTRDWIHRTPRKRFLWIGMNPSTAAANVDDPTIRKELMFTLRDGGNAYVKCNVMDYRATDPKDLLFLPDVRSERNLPTIMMAANTADVIVLAWGQVNRLLNKYYEETYMVLRDTSKPLYCLGCTNGGDPRHPLYVASTTKLEIYSVTREV